MKKFSRFHVKNMILYYPGRPGKITFLPGAFSRHRILFDLRGVIGRDRLFNILLDSKKNEEK